MVKWTLELEFTTPNHVYMEDVEEALSTFYRYLATTSTSRETIERAPVDSSLKDTEE